MHLIHCGNVHISLTTRERLTTDPWMGCQWVVLLTEKHCRVQNSARYSQHLEGRRERLTLKCEYILTHTHHHHHHHHHTSIYSAPITTIGYRCITESSELSANTERQTKKSVLSRFLNSPGSVTVCKSFGSESHADGLAMLRHARWTWCVTVAERSMTRTKIEDRDVDDRSRRDSQHWRYQSINQSIFVY